MTKSSAARSRPLVSARLLVCICLTLLAFSSSSRSESARQPLASNRVTSVVAFSDGALYGTAHGLFARTDSGMDGMIEGWDGFVTGLAEHDGVTIVGSTEGPLLLTRGVVQSLRVPSEWPDPFVSAVSFADSRLFFGGSNGLAEVSAGGDVREITIPTSGATSASGATPGELNGVEALAGCGPSHRDGPSRRDGADLLVAFDGFLYQFNPRREEWKVLVSGISYIALIGTAEGKWVGLRSDGGIDEGILGDPNARRTADSLDDDAFSAIALTADGRALLAGTARGRVLRADLGDVDDHLAGWTQIRTPGATDAAIRALAARDVKFVRAGTDGGGILEINLAPGIPVIKEIVSPNEPVLRVERAPEHAEGTAGGASLALMSWMPSVPFRTTWLGYIALAAALLVIATGLSWMAFRFRLSGGGGDGPREKRRQTGRHPDLPAIDSLSPDVASWARRFQDLTLLINDLSRVAAREMITPAAAEQARQASRDFEEIDERMRDRLDAIRAERISTQDRLREIRAKVRDGGADEKTLEIEVARIEQWLEQADRDERYLKYVIEE